MDVIEHLTEEHRMIEGLIERLTDSDPGSPREQLVGELQVSLANHMALEEQYLYPIVTEVIGSAEADTATAEHDLVRQGLSTLGSLGDQQEFRVVLQDVQIRVAQHVIEEETQLFPRLRHTAGAAIRELDVTMLDVNTPSVDADTSH